MNFKIILPILAMCLLAAGGTFGEDADVASADNVAVAPPPQPQPHPDDVAVAPQPAADAPAPEQQSAAAADAQAAPQPDTAAVEQSAPVADAEVAPQPAEKEAVVETPPPAEETKKADGAEGEATKKTDAVEKKDETDAEKKTESGADKKGGAWGWWTKLTCLILGPLGYGCPDKKGAAAGTKGEGQKEGRHLRGMFAVIQDSGEPIDQQVEILEEEAEGGDAEAEAQPEGKSGETEAEEQQTADAEADNGEEGKVAEGAGEGEGAADLKVSATAVETVTDEQGNAQTNVSEVKAEGTAN